MTPTNVVLAALDVFCIIIILGVGVLLLGLHRGWWS